MTRASGQFERLAAGLRRYRGLAVPLLAAALVAVVIVPLPPALLDVLLVGNLTLSALVLLTAIRARRPLEFSALPSVLLLGTLIRLVLNVASTRLILTAGGPGSSPETARLAAGHVIWAFSDFVTAGSLAVGVILFAILVVIQFVVITKGAGRISEVAARFTLDALPGKQMSIDSAVTSGLLSHEQARRQREQVQREADYFGAMDGASKFIRGDAVASVIITLVNLLGGLYVGVVARGWGVARSAELFSRLTIGDGLVTQVPALVLSVAAAMVASRPAGEEDLGEAVLDQLTGRPVVLAIAAGLLAMLTLTALPTVPLLLVASGLAAGAWFLRGRESVEGGTGADRSAPAALEAAGEAAPDEGADAESLPLPGVDAIRIELGYALVPLVDAEAGEELVQRLAELRGRIAEQTGLLVPAIRVRDNLHLPAHGYSILLRGREAGRGKIYPGQFLATGAAAAEDDLLGRPAREPVSGRPAAWIRPTAQGQAEMRGCTVRPALEVMLGHLAEVLRRRGSDLLTRQQVHRMLEALAGRCGHLVEEVREKLKVSQVQKALQALLERGVAIRDLETILEALCDAADSSDSEEVLSEAARCAVVSRSCEDYCGEDGRLWCVCLDETLEGELIESAQATPAGLEIPELLQRRLRSRVRQGLDALVRQGKRPIVLCAPHLRRAVEDLARQDEPAAAVLGYNEVRTLEVQPVEVTGDES